MNPLKTTGIVIRTSRGGDSSRALTVISPTLGKISVWARGIRSNKNPMRSGCALLSYSEFILLPRREMYSLTGCTPIQSFYHLREDVIKLSYAVYFADLAGAVLQESTEAEGVLRLLLNTLYYLEKDKKQPLDLKVLYELRLMKEAGFMPHTESCVLCGRPEADRFSPSHGGLLCHSCTTLPPLSSKALALLRFYISGSLRQALDFDGGEAAASLAKDAEDFVCCQTETHLRSLEYLHRIRNIVKQ